MSDSNPDPIAVTVQADGIPEPVSITLSIDALANELIEKAPGCARALRRTSGRFDGEGKHATVRRRLDGRADGDLHSCYWRILEAVLAACATSVQRGVADRQERRDRLDRDAAQ